MVCNILSDKPGYRVAMIDCLLKQRYSHPAFEFSTAQSLPLQLNEPCEERQRAIIFPECSVSHLQAMMNHGPAYLPSPHTSSKGRSKSPVPLPSGPPTYPPAHNLQRFMMAISLPAYSGGVGGGGADIKHYRDIKKDCLPPGQE